MEHREAPFVPTEGSAVEPLLEAADQIFDDAIRPDLFAIHDDARRAVGDHFDVESGLGSQNRTFRGGPVTA